MIKRLTNEERNHLIDEIYPVYGNELKKFDNIEPDTAVAKSDLEKFMVNPIICPDNFRDGITQDHVKGFKQLRFILNELKYLENEKL